MPAADGPRSVFVETVTVPLEDLYGGVERKELRVGNGSVERYVAAFRRSWLQNR